METLTTKEVCMKDTNAQMRFMFGEHGTAKDAAWLPDVMRGYDIFIPEVCAWTPRNVWEFQAVADGELSPSYVNVDDSTFPEHRLAELNALYGTKMRVVFVDLPHEWDAFRVHGVPLIDIYNGSSLALIFAMRMWKTDPLLAMDIFYKYLDLSVMFQCFREAHIVNNLSTIIQKYAREGVGLKVLVSLGSTHTNVFHRMRRVYGARVDAIFSHSPLYVFSHFSEAIRRSMFGKVVDSDLAIKALSESDFCHAMTFIDCTYQKVRVARHIATRLFVAKNVEDLPRIPTTVEVFDALVVAIRAEEMRRYGRASI